MELAGLIMLAVGLIVSAVFGLPKLYHFVRFRKLRVRVDGAQVLLEKLGHVFVGKGQVILNVQGAAHPVTLKEGEVSIRTSPRTRIGSRTSLMVDIPPLQWSLIKLSYEGIPFEEDPLPTDLEVEVYLSNPDDVYVKSLTLRLSEDGSKYYYVDQGHTRYLYRTVWRRHTRLRRLLRTVSRGRLG